MSRGRQDGRQYYCKPCQLARVAASAASRAAQMQGVAQQGVVPKPWNEVDEEEVQTTISASLATRGYLNLKLGLA